MRYFDAHLHIAEPSEEGLHRLLRFLEDDPNLVGGNLILNTPVEVELVYANSQLLPPSLNIIPYFDPVADFPREFTRSGWFKIHPSISNVTADRIADLTEAVAAARPQGIVVHAFPWGPTLGNNTSLAIVIAIARALPEMPVLVAHGGGYESWQFRAHAGMLPNVYFDFSVTMAYYQGSDLLRPFQRYLQYSRNRILFGSDWPSAQPNEQLAECARLAYEIGIGSNELEQVFLDNSRNLWPDYVNWSAT